MVISVDPGKTGYIAAQGEGAPWVMPLAQGAPALWMQLKETHALWRQAEWIIERQWGRPGQMDWNLAEPYGYLIMGCEALGITPKLVTPQSWKKKAWPERKWPKLTGDLRERRKVLAERKAQAKQESVELARSLYPEMADQFLVIGPRGGVTLLDGKAEALLIGRFGPLV